MSIGRFNLRDVMADPYTVTKLRYPSQFALGPDFVERLSGSQYRVAELFKLTLHPDLPCTQVTEGFRELTLIGHMLDPLAPAAGNEEVLWRLLRRYANGDRATLIEATAGLGGRWALVAANGEERFMFNDAMGLRQVFYVDPRETGALWVVSQPGLIAEMLALPVDPEAEQFMQSYAFRSNPEYRWPGEATAFRTVRHLLPNHWLDLNTGVPQRFWPDRPLALLKPEEAVQRLEVLLPGIIQAAAQRFNLALSLTSGLDSRLLLAAARNVRDRISFVTVRQSKMSDYHPDVTVPARLLQRLGLPHQIVSSAATTTADFSSQFKHAVYLAHEHYGPDAEAILRSFSRTKVALTGSGAEIGRCSFRKALPRSRIQAITATDLSELQNMEREPFALHQFENWLVDARARHNVKLLDLFEWEQGHGNWLAMTQLEFDMAWRDIVTPYNCREVLTTLLAVDERYRRPPESSLFTMLIRRLWPEVLSEPINPHEHRVLLLRIKRKLRALARFW